MAHYLSTFNTVNRWLEHFINIRACVFEVLRDLANVNELANNVFFKILTEQPGSAKTYVTILIFCHRFTTNTCLKIKIKKLYLTSLI